MIDASSAADLFRSPVDEEDACITLPLWLDDYTVLEKAAQDAGISMSELGRRVIYKLTQEPFRDVKHLKFWVPKSKRAEFYNLVAPGMAARTLAEALHALADEVRKGTLEKF